MIAPLTTIALDLKYLNNIESDGNQGWGTERLNRSGKRQ